MLDTIGDALPREIERCTEVLRNYEELGTVGAVGAMIIRRDIKQAVQAIAAGDVVVMLTAYQALKGVK